VKTVRAAGAILAFAAIAVALAARRGRDGATELEPHVPRPGPVTPPPFAAALPPPTASEVEDGLRRAFGGTVRPAGAPQVLVGDFNGDGVEDVAVPVSPRPDRLADLNDDLANWRVQDALAPEPPEVPPASPASPTPPVPVAVRPEEVLLAVVHGYGPRGWRDQQARQCYLVRHATGAPLETRPRTDLLRHARRRPDEPKLAGDVILASMGTRAGFVYWTGARYAWHPLPVRVD
jgi:hypothetical protein